MPAPLPSSHRVSGFDLARALAVLGMIVVNYTSMFEVSRFSPAWLEPVVDFLYGRAAVVFVMLAGLSISLVAGRCVSVAELRTLRRRLIERSLLLLVAGMTLWRWWAADILHFYAVFIAVGIWGLTWPATKLRRWTAAVFLVSLPVCAALTTAYDFNDAFALVEDSPLTAGWILQDYFTSPYYSILPWLGYFLAGMLLGRREPADAVFWRRACLAGAVGCLAVELFSGACVERVIRHGWELEGLWWGTFLRSEAFPATPLFVLSSVFSGLAVIGFCQVISSNPRRTLSGIDALAAFGRLSLTLYVAHIAWGILFKKWIADPSTDIGSNSMLLTAASFALCGAIFSLSWLRYFQRGPLETLFHWFTHGRRSCMKATGPARSQSMPHDAGG
jgi:uncharacterized protein